MDSVLVKLSEEKYWTEVFEFFQTRAFRQTKKLDAYKQILENKTFIDISRHVLAGTYRFNFPIQIEVNKMQTGKKKTVYLFDFQDDFLLKVVNRILTDEFAHCISPSCHSFQKQKGAKTAFRELIKDKELNNKHCLKTDIRNFFNSIQVSDFMHVLPDELKADIPLLELIKQLLLNNLVRLPNGSIQNAQKGLMAGCPLAPFLSNIYLRQLDNQFTNNKITYTRYSDDIVVFDYQENIQKHLDSISAFLSEKKLVLNDQKTSISKPHEPAIFLGFSYHSGQIDLSPVSAEKLKSKIKRLSRSFHRKIQKGKLSSDKALTCFISRINRKIYGIDAIQNELCWAHWFFPVINRPETLEALDAYIQQRLRYSVTGKYAKSNFKAVPYRRLCLSGYIPMKTAFYAFKKDYQLYLKRIKVEF